VRSLRRKPKPKVVPITTIKAAWIIRDPARDEREAQVEVRAWAASQVAGLPPLAVPVRRDV
jgi:hypothetical protein